MKPLLMFLSLGLFLTSCNPNRPKNIIKDLAEINEVSDLSDNVKMNEKIEALDLDEKLQFSKDKCIPRQFRFEQGQDDHLYGKICFQGERYIDIKLSAKDSSPVNTNLGELKLEDNNHPDFINKVYEATNHQVVGGTEGMKDFLSRLLPKTEEIRFALQTGDKDKTYRIIYQIQGNYLVLFKASKNLNDIPYIERTSLVKDGDFYKVPLIGYPVQHCSAERTKNAQGEERYLYRAVCNKAEPHLSSFIQFNSSRPVAYNYIQDKTDLFPSKYFEGEWFYTSHYIVSPTDVAHVSFANAFLVKLEKTTDSLTIKDVSGDIEERSQAIIDNELLVDWLEYKIDKNEGDDGFFNNFREIIAEGQSNLKQRPYLRLKFKAMGMDVEDLLVTEDYFSYTVKTSYKTGDPEKDEKYKNKQAKKRYSFLRSSVLDNTGFIQRRPYFDDIGHVFGVISTLPQSELQEEDDTNEKDRYKHIRMIRFNTSQKETIIKWYFSDLSVKDEWYRDIARQTVRIWNKTFENITREYCEFKNEAPNCKKIKLELVENDEKALGDMRYNIINLVKSKDYSPDKYILFGYGPSAVNPNTGQIVGAAVNTFINSTEFIYRGYVRDYIRYEVFQKIKGRKTDKENAAHVVSSFVKAKINQMCKNLPVPVGDNIDSYIKIKQAEVESNNLQRRDTLGINDFVLECAKTLSRGQLLETTLHEMGHALGLSHNFRASVDKENYYKDIKDMQSYFPREEFPDLESQLIKDYFPKSSSVMDYLPFDMPDMPVIGKYDQEALRYLYLGQVSHKDERDKEGKKILLSVDIADKPENQNQISQFILDNKKQYQHCSDWIHYQRAGALLAGQQNNVIDFLCIKRDYGSDPVKIINYYKDSFNRNMNNRYSYESSGIEPPSGGTISYNSGYLKEMVYFYEKWMMLRNQFLTNRQLLKKAIYNVDDPATKLDESQEVITSYQTLIEENSSKSQTEYSQYYPLRDIVPQFFIDEILLTETMKCKVIDQQGETYVLDLEDIKNELKQQTSKNKEVYIENCYSSLVKEFLALEGLTLFEQTGKENFASYSLEGNNSGKVDVWSIDILRSIYYSIEKQHQLPIMAWLFQWTYEPDLLHKLKVKIDDFYFSTGKGRSASDYRNMQNNRTSYLTNLMIMSSVDQDMLSKNRKQFNILPFYDIGVGSFVNQLSQYQELGDGIKGLNIPFLSQLYKNYKEEENNFECTTQNSKICFRDYLKQSNSIIYINDELMIPYQSQSLIEKYIIQYNKVKQEVKDLEGESDQLNFIQRTKLGELIRHRDFLLTSILESLGN